MAFMQRGRVQLYLHLQTVHVFVPALAGALMIIASVLPWLIDPLGQVSTAWNISIDAGWQVRSAVVSYGLLCCCCGLAIWLGAYVHKEPDGTWHICWKDALPRRLSALCLLPVIMFFLQYLCIDVIGIDQLGQHEVQARLVVQHFGYSTPAQRIPMNPLFLDNSTIWTHLQLLINLVSIGIVLPCASFCLLLSCKRTVSLRRSRTWRKPLLALIAVLLGVLYARPFIALACDYEAKGLLAAGNYASALQWLERARRFNPALDTVAYYHIERGQALYFLNVNQQSGDSQVYLAFTYRGQRGYLDAYQQMLGLWQAQRTTPWVVDQMSQTLQRLTENMRPLGGVSSTRVKRDSAALVWVQLLKQVDATNVYGCYMLGRIQYELSNFATAKAEMAQVISLSGNRTIQSSAYTYMALSDAGLGNYVEERTLLFKAVELDVNYSNNTARENLSGLR